MSSSLTLIILAAGLGSRFGGNKHAAEVGPQGQCLFEYSVSDAIQAGFDHILFVVSPSQNTNEIGDRLKLHGSTAKIEYVVQSIDSDAITTSAMESRTKPLGTAHAVLVCRPYIQNPFALVNADDYYGAENFVAIARYLNDNRGNPKAAVMPGYRLSKTLSASGGVNRGVCRVNDSGYLEKIVEVENISAQAAIGKPSAQVSESNAALDFTCDDPAQEVFEDSIVSMNFWGFQPDIFTSFDALFCEFLNSPAIAAGGELVIPTVVDYAIKVNQLQVKVLPTNTQWQGLTHATDLDEVKRFIAALIEKGEYQMLSRRAS